MNRFLALTVLTFVTAGLLLSHEARLHGANAFIGEATAVSGKGLELKTKTGTVKVKYSSKTKFEQDGKAAAKNLLKVGDKVGVAGTKLPNGDALRASQTYAGAPNACPRKATGDGEPQWAEECSSCRIWF